MTDDLKERLARADAKAAAEEYANNPDSPTQSNHHSCWVDPEAAFLAGAQWQLARHRSEASSDKLAVAIAALDRIADECEGTAPKSIPTGVAGKCHRIARQALERIGR